MLVPLACAADLRSTVDTLLLKAKRHSRHGPMHSFRWTLPPHSCFLSHPDVFPVFELP